MLHPERVLRFLDRLDCAGCALRLAWGSYLGAWLRAVSLAACVLVVVALARLPPG